MNADYKLLAILAAIGAMVGIGQLLNSEQPITWRAAAGRAIVTCGLSVSAGLILALLPAVPPLAVIGLAATSASLGTSFLERLAQRFVGAK